MYRYYIVNRNGNGQMSFPDAYPHSEPVSYGDNGVGFDRIRMLSSSPPPLTPLGLTWPVSDTSTSPKSW